MKLRYQEQMSHKMSPSKSVTQMPKHIFLVDNNDNINTPHISNTVKETGWDSFGEDEPSRPKKQSKQPKLNANRLQEGRWKFER